MVRFTLLILTLCTGFVLPGVSQIQMVDKAYNHLKANELQEGLQAISIAVENESTSKDPKAWYLKAYILKELAKSFPDSATYRYQALEAIRQSKKLDPHEQLAKETSGIESFLYVSLMNDAIEFLNQEAYSAAIELLKPITSAVDNEHYGEALYYTAYAQLMLGKSSLANPLFEQALEANYQDPLVYEQLIYYYNKQGEQQKAQATLQKGLATYPADQRIQIAGLNIYMAEQNFVQAEALAENYLSQFPGDLDVLLLAGTIYEKRFQADTADRPVYFMKRKNVYLSALKLSPENSVANYNLGITLYNQAVSIINDADIYSLDIVEFDHLLSSCTQLFQEALPYIKKANNLEPDNINTLKALEGIYYNLNDREQIALVRKSIEKLK